MTTPLCADVDAIARVLAKAFQQDPLFRHFFPRPETRQANAFLTFRFLASHARSKGQIVITDGDLHGAAVWVPSHHYHRSVVDMLRFGATRMALRQSPAALLRQIRASDHMETLHRRLIPQPHWYLSLLGVDPTQQGRGLSRELLQPMLAQADSAALPCFLDTHNPDNVSLYQRFGFQVVHEGLMPGTTVRHWAMQRDPRQV
ncbi:hypothetical protein A11A3_15147 [Alcanivorax hongdengensis A-11-3]|uniref:N-acetyltransferase domain-containing protein n=1 Tax=Alcanivorax hongdengensis A-11-3 TaxID=1177179 RepID=L0WBN2_9GAMM|nr:GNAT family N-acetyltransferase [Alcanivorax hongdengensis]EKF73150.1 hypothetical protein A11A3_15147 [Alcanivorax hongdengensis A-11-3]